MSSFLFYSTNILSGLLDMLLCMIFFSVMCGKRKKHINRVIYITSYLVMEGVLFANTWLDPYFSGPTFYLYCIISSMLTLLLISLEHHDTMRHRFLVICSFQVLAMLSEVFSSSLTRFFINPVENTDKLSIDIFISKLIMSIFIFVLFFCFSKDNMKRSPAHIFFVMYMPIVSIFILYRLWDSGVNGLSNRDIVINLILYTAIVLSNLINFFLLKLLIKSAEVQEQKNALGNQIKLQEERYVSAVASFKQVRSLVHDTRKHDLYIRECISQEHYSELKRYLDKRLTIGENIDIPINTGNLAIDALVNNCDSICKGKGIRLNLDIDVDTSLIPLDDFELNIVLGNLLDNSVYYSGLSPTMEQPFIDVSIKTFNETFIIRCTNSYPQTSISIESNPLKGCGLINVEKIVTQHFGVFTSSTAEQTYESIVSIPLHKLQTR